MKYRPDIDGLRTIAVIPVVLFHAGVPAFGGGYIGVDVFFVISGYLITSLILSQQQRGEFTLTWFYERRIRRIFPALFVVMFFCVIAGWAVMTPNDYKSLGGSIFATSVFLSNVLFWARSGYFEPQAEQQPLLHTWSLAVEEQFYIVFPVLIILLTRTRISLFRVVVFLALVSFVVASILVVSSPISAFYLAPFRAWELLVGSLLAIKTIPFGYGNRLRNLLSLSGLSMIFFAVYFYSKETLFPGISAILPALGAALFIWAGADSSPFVNRFISSRPIIFVGQISYSLYLWHFVLLKFGTYLIVTEMTAVQTGIILILSAICAVLSWLFVERPVRRSSLPIFSGRALFGVAGLAIAILSLTGVAIRSTNGFEMRLTEAQRRLIDTEGRTDSDNRECPPTTLQVAKSHIFCKIGNEHNITASFLAWGDSHGFALAPALDAVAKERGNAGFLVVAGGCPPLIDIVRENLELRDCEEISQNVLKFIIAEKSIKSVIIIARWAYYTNGVTYKYEPTNLFNTKHVLLANKSMSESRSTQEVMAISLERTVGDLLAAGKQVWIVGPVPEIGINVPKALYLTSVGIRKEFQIAPTREEFNLRQGNVIQMIKAAMARYSIRVVWPDKALCDNKLCMVVSNGRSLYQDDNHLSKYGAMLVKPVLEEVQME